ncbi:ubiquitin carboxyl-terminal hydrolase 37-like [Centropristis striata]|uniref:ubiquitin carboxyl-terminal hydrolase 37-like n=1 Tax=Centropristis striata TaxID=184440 RepID=UPI0027DED3F5|nr:ubiquitin carboxyl-terminal hydrolase 37-like [Centropristis striata]
MGLEISHASLNFLPPFLPIHLSPYSKSTVVVGVVADESLQTSGSRKSVSVPDTLAATNNKVENVPWGNRLFGYHIPRKANQSIVVSENNNNTKTKKARWWRCCRKTRRVTPTVTPQQDEVVDFKGLIEEKERLEDKTVLPTESKKKKKKEKNVVLPETIKKEKDERFPQAVQPKKCQAPPAPTPHQDTVVEFKGLTEEEERLLGVDETIYQNLSKGKDAISPSKSIRQEKEDTVLHAVSENKEELAINSIETHIQEKEGTVLQAVQPKKRRAPPAPTPHQDTVVPKGKDSISPSKTIRQEKKETVLQAVPMKNNPPTETFRQQQIHHLGFPNPAQFCYINSCLQSLLTLKDFVNTISCQELIWNLLPDAALLRSFMDIKESHSSGDVNHKIRLVNAFRKTIWSPEFHDLQQKDAHEFLTSILDQMRCLSPQLQVMAASMDTTYSCPVEQHMVFKMLNIRTCKRCGTESHREEEFTNLSLDLIPGGGSVEDMIKEYLMEKELDYNCECGATTSVQRSSFLTVPRVLVLHLKRFRITPTFTLTKVHDPIVLLRDLVVTTDQAGALYSLVSSINHISPSQKCGHYICDGVDTDIGQEDLTDRWFTYNDSVVTETSGDNVCNQREKTSYILFYQRQD